MDIKTIAKKNQISERFVYMLVNGERFTDLHFLAMDVASMTGKRPIQYIRPVRRALFKRVMPMLNEKVTK